MTFFLCPKRLSLNLSSPFFFIFHDRNIESGEPLNVLNELNINFLYRFSLSFLHFSCGRRTARSKVSSSQAGLSFTFFFINHCLKIYQNIFSSSLHLSFLCIFEIRDNFPKNFNYDSCAESWCYWLDGECKGNLVN